MKFFTGVNKEQFCVRLEKICLEQPKETFLIAITT